MLGNKLKSLKPTKNSNVSCHLGSTGSMLIDYVEIGKTINSEYYITILERLMIVKIATKQSEDGFCYVRRQSFKSTGRYIVIQ